MKRFLCILSVIILVLLIVIWLLWPKSPVNALDTAIDIPTDTLWTDGPSCYEYRQELELKSPLNVLIISIDTLRADHLSCYGYQRQTTPNIDLLADDSYLFSNAYTTLPGTLPAHTSLLTSLYPRQLSLHANGIVVSSKVTTLAEILESSGYSTAAFISTSALDARYGLNQGFQTYSGVGDTKLELPATDTVSGAIQWLGGHKNETFFLFVHFFDPHTRYNAPEDYRKKFDVPNEGEPLEDYIFIQNPGQFTPERVRDIIAAYDAEIAYADWAVGKLLEELDKLGLKEDTIVVLVSDHGESLDELIKSHGYAFDHGEFLYTHQLHIPLIIRMPSGTSQEKGVVQTTPVSIIDVMPTILDSLKIRSPDYMAGTSLLPLLFGQTKAYGPVFSERRSFETPPKPYFAGDDYSIIEDKWHLIFSTIRESELYNLSEDDREKNNLSNQAKKIEALESKIESWRKQIKPLFGASVPDTNEAALEKLRSLGYTK